MTLCGCVTVMAVGYRAQGQGGSKEMYFYSCFQGTVLVQRLMSQERCKPPSNKSPSPSQEALSFPSTISKENVIVSQISSNFFLTRRAKGQHILFVCGHWGKKEQMKQWNSLWSIKQSKKKCPLSNHQHANISKYVPLLLKLYLVAAT